MNIKEIKESIKRSIRLVAARIPTELPDTLEKHESWVTDVLELGGFPNNDSFRATLATMILHVSADKVKMPKVFFINAIRRSIINQLAWGLQQKYKESAKVANEQAI